jgi:2-polyprenyl-3-methyl-5-hydroxy-6-metoxy-1,4-benzoquinol methylase
MKHILQTTHDHARTNAGRENALLILRHNVGFARPEPWVDYAIENRFREIPAYAVPNCPDCGAPPAGEMGEYIHYSTLMRLRRCGSCHLIWSDARVDPGALAMELQTTFDNRDYFAHRTAIFHHLARQVSRMAPLGGRVLDIGGAQGDLMHLVGRARPDLTTVVHDVSPLATRYASEHFGLPVICGDFSVFRDHQTRYDIVVLSDVLYYEHRLRDAWRLLRRLVAPGGMIILRVPNKLLFIRAGYAITRLMKRIRPRRIRDTVDFFNPAHLCILTRRYLTQRLRRSGFSEMKVLPSPPLVSPAWPARAAAGLWFAVASAIALLTRRRLIATPSMLVVARRG